MTLDSQQIEAIKFGEVRQGCFDAAMRLLSRRLHSREELSRKLKRQEWGDEIIEHVLKDLARLGYVDDARFAKTKALSAATHKHHGRRRAVVELLKAGVERETARRAVEDVYDPHDSLAVARNLAQKKAAHLRRLDPLVAKRRLTGMLARRGFEYDVVRPVIDEVLGAP
jgi:regulatory protein